MNYSVSTSPSCVTALIYRPMRFQPKITYRITFTIYKVIQTSSLFSILQSR